MPMFSFYRCLDDGSRLKLASEELGDREAARDFGVQLAQEILQEQGLADTPARSRVVIYDHRGEDLDVIISEAA